MDRSRDRRFRPFHVGNHLAASRVKIGPRPAEILSEQVPDRCFPQSTLRMKILLVEDHQETRHTLQRLIERRRHEVLGVDSAEEAKQALLETKFPFLILDWMLPGKSGVELCRELRS